jgi:mono/diheme cytochrome c family protein
MSLHWAKHTGKGSAEQTICFEAGKKGERRDLVVKCGDHEDGGYAPARTNFEERTVLAGKSKFWSALVVCSGLWIVACSDEPATTSSGSGGSGGAVPAASPTPKPTPSAPPRVLSREELIEAGRGAYNANCIACHSMDPTKDGALGPAVTGSSLALITARVLRAEYPEGYTPKRNTRVMVALPHLEPQLNSLAAYLDSLE